MPGDVFPATLHTWIDDQLQRGGDGRRAVNAYLMATYAWPLRVYYLGSSARWLGEPDEIVNGFLADRLGRNDFMAGWQASGLRLRRWLINGFCFYLREEIRRRRRGAIRKDAANDDALTFSGDPARAFEAASVCAFVRRALDLAESACRAADLEPHWAVFREHHLNGRPFQVLADERGLSAGRAAVMCRTATRRFREALREVVWRDGVPDGEVDDEIRRMLEASL